MLQQSGCWYVNFYCRCQTKPGELCPFVFVVCGAFSHGAIKLHSNFNVCHHCCLDNSSISVADVGPEPGERCGGGRADHHVGLPTHPHPGGAAAQAARQTQGQDRQGHSFVLFPFQNRTVSNVEFTNKIMWNP